MGARSFEFRPAPLLTSIRALAPHPDLPEDTRLWAALVTASGGVWGGCVYDPGAIISKLQAE